MATISVEALKALFETGDKPTQSDFWALLDSYRHKMEQIPMSDIALLSQALAAKANSADLQEAIRNLTLSADMTTVDISDNVIKAIVSQMADNVLEVTPSGLYVKRNSGKTFMTFAGYFSPDNPTTVPGNYAEGDIWVIANFPNMASLPNPEDITTANYTVYQHQAEEWVQLTDWQYQENLFDLWANRVDNHGYYRFGQEWNLLDANVDLTNYLQYHISATAADALQYSIDNQDVLSIYA